MAYYDENGRITIDEVAAEKDITNLNCANESIRNVMQLIDQMIVLASEIDSETNKGIMEFCTSIKRDINNLSDDTDSTKLQIQKTIDKYKEIDKKLKNIIASGEGEI